MPETIPYMDALRRWNAGMPSWCIPRKGTAGYDSIMRIRRGEKTKTPHEIAEETKHKKKERKPRKSMKVKLDDE